MAESGTWVVASMGEELSRRLSREAMRSTRCDSVATKSGVGPAWIGAEVLGSLDMSKRTRGSVPVRAREKMIEFIRISVPKIYSFLSNKMKRW